MEPLYSYVLKSSGLLLVFYLAYYFLLRKETFFTHNRWFLLAGLVTSLLLPIIRFTKILYIERPELTYADVVDFSASTSIIEQPIVVEPFDSTPVFYTIYFLITAFFIFKILLSIVSFFRLKSKGQLHGNVEYKIVYLNEECTPFSFFNYIVLNPSIYSTQELDSIILHEKVHCQEKHSIDVLVVQLLCAVFWFNPIMWLYRKALLQNLEYIADQKATAQLEDKKSYQLTLLKVVSNQNCLLVTNNFYQSLIKKRIVMLNKKQSNKRNSWKYSLVVPFLIGFIFLFQIETKAQVKETATDIIPSSPVSSSSTFSSIVTKSTTDKELRELEKTFTSATEKLIISKVKRNNRGEIIEIKLVFDTGKTYVNVFERKSNEPIAGIKIYVETNDDSIKTLGFKEVKETGYSKILPLDEEKIEINGLSTDESSDYWSMDNMTKDGKEVVLIINGKVKGATEKVKIPINEELGEMKELTASAFEKKYKIKAVKDKYYYEVETVKVKKVDLKSNKVIVYSRDQKSELNKLFIINGKEILQDDIPKGTSISLDGEIIEIGKEEGIRKYGQKAKDGVLLFDGISTYTIPSKQIKSDETNQENVQPGYIFDKISSDSEIESTKTELKEKYNIVLKVHQLKRNAKGEIIALKLSFDDQKGIKGKKEQIRNIAIRPIFLKVKIDKNGRNDIGFYDNHTMKTLPKDDEKERKISLIENLNDDAIIYVDGELYDKENLELLDVNGLKTIKILKDKESLKKYKATTQNEVIIIETNWTTKK